MRRDVPAGRSWKHSTLATLRVPNPASRWVTLFAVGFLTLVLTVPGLQQIFHFARPSAQALGLSLLATAGCAVWFEVLKRARVSRPAERRLRPRLGEQL